MTTASNHDAIRAQHPTSSRRVKNELHHTIELQNDPTEPPKSTLNGQNRRLNGAGPFPAAHFSGQSALAIKMTPMESNSVTWKAIRSTGGFIEGFVYLTRYLHSHTGYGIDDPGYEERTGKILNRLDSENIQTLEDFLSVPVRKK
jgi:hypothetical protein